MERYLIWFSRLLGIIAALAIVVLMMAIVVDVTVRFIVRSSVPGMLEIAEASLVVCVFFGLAWTAIKGGHIDVDFLVEKFSPTVKIWVARVIWISTTVVLTGFVYATIIRAIASTATHETRFGLVQWPLYPLRWVIVIGFTCWLLVAITNVIRCFTGRRPYGEDHDPLIAV